MESTAPDVLLLCNVAGDEDGLAPGLLNDLFRLLRGCPRGSMQIACSRTLLLREARAEPTCLSILVLVQVCYGNVSALPGKSQRHGAPDACTWSDVTKHTDMHV